MLGKEKKKVADREDYDLATSQFPFKAATLRESVPVRDATSPQLPRLETISPADLRVPLR